MGNAEAKSVAMRLEFEVAPWLTDGCEASCCLDDNGFAYSSGYVIFVFGGELPAGMVVAAEGL